MIEPRRAPSLWLFAAPRPTTPHLDAFARDGAVSENAIATSSWSLPSHASMLTGLWPHEQGGGTVGP
ncbi:MAG: sulfatase-like hydrolase/transferase [Gemmatimonadaceae bacterium]